MGSKTPPETKNSVYVQTYHLQLFYYVAINDFLYDFKLIACIPSFFFQIINFRLL